MLLIEYIMWIMYTQLGLLCWSNSLTFFDPLCIVSQGLYLIALHFDLRKLISCDHIHYGSISRTHINTVLKMEYNLKCFTAFHEEVYRLFCS